MQASHDTRDASGQGMHDTNIATIMLWGCIVPLQQNQQQKKKGERRTSAC